MFQFTLSLQSKFVFQPVVLHLACVLLHLSMEEALVAATINAAASLGKADTHGSIEVGKIADMVIIDAHRYALSRLISFMQNILPTTNTTCHMVHMPYFLNMVL